MNIPPFPDDDIPASPEALSLTAINKLARVYCASYASPHHITFTVEGLRHFVEAINRGAGHSESQASHLAGGGS